MLEFCKEVLTKVSFDGQLFKKELQKAIHRLNIKDNQQLKKWCLSTFGALHHQAILDSFQAVSI